MNKRTPMQTLPLIAGAALLLLAGAAHAQYVWIDANGHKQISDQAPPPSVPASKILKSRAIVAPSASTPEDKPAATGKSVAEIDADFRKRMAAKNEAETKAAAAAAEQAQKKARCDKVRTNNAQLATGQRLRYATGDRAVMDDKARAKEQAVNNEALADCN